MGGRAVGHRPRTAVGLAAAPERIPHATISESEATMSEELEIVIKAKDKASHEINGVGSALSNLGSIAGKVALGGLALAAGATIGLTVALVDCVKEAMAAEEVQAALNAVLKSTGGVAGVTAKAANALATSLSKVTKFDDDAILSGENLMLTFTSIGKDIFPQATETALDMSQALGQDLKSSVTQLGKALQDPITGITALRRVGVNFTDEQENMIKALVESGDLMGAQKLILAELNKEFGGAARAAGETAGGAFVILQNAIGNVKEEIGTAFLPVLTTLALELGKIVNDWGPKVAGFFTELIPKISAAIGGLSGAYQAGGFAGLGAKLLADIGSFWATYLAPELGTWPGKFWSWLTGEGGVLAGITVELNKLSVGMTEWVNSGQTATMFQGVGESIANFIVDSVAGIFGSDETGNKTMGAFHTALVSAGTSLSAAFKTIGADIATGLVTGFVEKITGQTIKDETAASIKQFMQSVVELANPISLGEKFFTMWYEGFSASLSNLLAWLNGENLTWDQLRNAMPSFASGGIVPGPAGERRQIMAEGGEVVLNQQQQQQLLFNMTVNTRASAATVIQDFNMLRAMAGV